MKATPFPRSRKGFSLVELLLSMTVLTAILLMFVGLLDQTQKTWDFSRSQISQFREARVAFDIMTKNLGQATLNAYFEQVDKDGKRASDFADPKDFFPVAFDVQSELQFRVLRARDVNVAGMQSVGPGHALFFQAPLGSTADQRYTALTNLLNGRGYFVAYVSDADFRPSFLNSLQVETKKRYRLMEFIPPTEQNQIYAAALEAEAAGNNPANRMKWITVPLGSQGNMGSLRPLAENIVALIVSPREAVADAAQGTGAAGAQTMTQLAQADRLATQNVAPNFVYDSAVPVSANWPKHTLPPLVQVTMVAIDEISAMRLEERYGDNYMDKFVQGTQWMNAADAYQQHLKQLVDAFEAEANRPDGVRINFKVFTSTVRINGAKWSAVPQTTP
jgi:uncharacterized protein (TIGR02599 family)